MRPPRQPPGHLSHLFVLLFPEAGCSLYLGPKSPGGEDGTSPVLVGLMSHLLLVRGHTADLTSPFRPLSSLLLRVGKDGLIARKIIAVTATISEVLKQNQALGG